MLDKELNLEMMEVLENYHKKFVKNNLTDDSLGNNLSESIHITALMTILTNQRALDADIQEIKKSLKFIEATQYL